MPLSEIAVLYRTHIQSRPLEEAFIRAGVPHVAGCAGPHACHVIHRVVYRCPPGHPSRSVPVLAMPHPPHCVPVGLNVVHHIVYRYSPRQPPHTSNLVHPVHYVV